MVRGDAKSVFHPQVVPSSVASLSQLTGLMNATSNENLIRTVDSEFDHASELKYPTTVIVEMRDCLLGPALPNALRVLTT